MKALGQAVKSIGWSPFWGLVLCFIVVGTLAISSFSSFLLEDLQMIAFPLVLFCFWRLPLSRRRQMPLGLLLAAFLLWLLSAGAAFGVFSALSPFKGVYISRLAKDDNGLGARSIYKRYNEVASIYQVPEMDMLSFGFADLRAAKTWLAKHPAAPFVLVGNATWLQVVFPGSSSRFLGMYPNVLAKEDLPPSILARAESLALSPGDDVFIVEGPVTGQYLAIEYQPEWITIATKPTELLAHVLVWFASGLRSESPTSSTPNEGSQGDSLAPESWSIEEDQAQRFAAWFEASQIKGHWKSPTGPGVGYYFLGTLSLLEGISLESVQPGAIELSIKWFRKASACFSLESDAPFYAAVFNNAAVALLFANTLDGDQRQHQARLKKAESWFREALKARHQSLSTSLTIGSRAAFFNLMSLAEDHL